MLLENENIRDLAGLQVEVTVVANYGRVFLSNEVTHNCFSRLRSINEYVVTRVDMTASLAVNILQQTGYLWSLVSSPRAALLSMHLCNSSQATGGL